MLIVGYKFHQCPECGELVGWVGRAMMALGLPVHTCPPAWAPDSSGRVRMFDEALQKKITAGTITADKIVAGKPVLRIEDLKFYAPAGYSMNLSIYDFASEGNPKPFVAATIESDPSNGHDNAAVWRSNGDLMQAWNPPEMGFVHHTRDGFLIIGTVHKKEQ